MTTLYHYSAEPHWQLMTRRKLGIPKEEIVKAEAHAKKLGLEGAYVDHISFFFDPIPTKLLPQIYGDQHRAWAKGTRLYEHTVDVSTLDSQILYRVVESAACTKLAYGFPWPAHDDLETLLRFLAMTDKLQRKNGELGIDRKELERQILVHKGHTTANFILASERTDFNDGREKYAANVPHLMIYPTSGEIKVDTISAITMGSSTRTPFVKDKPVWTTW